MYKILLVLGTRPEAIKLAPVIKKLEEYNSKFIPIVCVTTQHRKILNQVLTSFDISPDYDLNIMKENQGLFNIAVKSLKGLKKGNNADK